MLGRFFDLSVISTVFDIHMLDLHSFLAHVWSSLVLASHAGLFVDFVQVFAFLEGFCCGLSLAV